MVTRTVAIIPARGGSQSIPDKNIREFAGRPLIEWTIDTALKAKGLDRVIVSTDSERIAAVARNAGAEVPFLRPAAISASDTAMEPVLRHACEWLTREGYPPDVIVLLIPTNPLRQIHHVEGALKLFMESGADSVISVNESPAHYTPYWTVVRDRAGSASYFGGLDIRNGFTRRQAFPQKCFAKNDLVYVMRPANLFEASSNIYGKRVELYETGRIYDGDINTPEDWEVTLLAFNYLESQRQRGRT